MHHHHQNLGKLQFYDIKFHSMPSSTVKPRLSLLIGVGKIVRIIENMNTNEEEN